MNKQPTKKQHFVPRMILKHHTYFQIPMKKPIIYQYDKEKGICRTVDIYDICRKNNLYEFHKENGEIEDSLRNLIENELARDEARWDKIINKILNCENLIEEEVVDLHYMFAVQLLRLPDVQKEIVSLYKDKINDQLYEDVTKFTDTNIKNWAKYASLPVGSIVNDDQIILKLFFEKLAKKELTICKSKDILVINGNWPIVIYPNNFDCDFPITPHVCLRLREKHNNKDYEHLSRNDVRKLNNYIIAHNGRFVYSSIPYDQIIK